MKFIADVHLGKLAQLLRMLGLDTCYSNVVSIGMLINTALDGNRILLTKNHVLQGKHDVEAFVIAHENPEIQLQQVIEHFNLKSFHPFSRCIVCNDLLQPVEKERVLSNLQANTAKHFHEFWQCEKCNRIYWKGSHYERMRALLQEELGFRI